MSVNTGLAVGARRDALETYLFEPEQACEL